MSLVITFMLLEGYFFSKVVKACLFTNSISIVVIFQDFVLFARMTSRFSAFVVVTSVKVFHFTFCYLLEHSALKFSSQAAFEVVAKAL